MTAPAKIGSMVEREMRREMRGAINDVAFTPPVKKILDFIIEKSPTPVSEAECAGRLFLPVEPICRRWRKDKMRVSIFTIVSYARLVHVVANAQIELGTGEERLYKIARRTAFPSVSDFRRFLQRLHYNERMILDGKSSQQVRIFAEFFTQFPAQWQGFDPTTRTGRLNAEK